MSELLYYSNYCTKCQDLLQILNKSPLKEKIHFLCIDQRTREANGNISLLLKNGTKNSPTKNNN